ncbi:MAG: hypothetical protein HOW73_40110 [Polyangiaceae bacterium]|nr:hypothetical protein [Polyangiaceae bacterium]
MHTTHSTSRRPRLALPLALVGLFSCSLLTATGCDYLEKKANEKIQEELKSDTEKKLGDDDAKSSASSSAKASGGESASDEVAGDKPASDKPAAHAAAADGTVWTDAGGTTTKMSRVSLDPGGLKGFTMLAPEGAQVKASLGGRGTDVASFGVGFAVWVLEDPTVTLPLMKEAASAKFGKESKIVHEDANSIIVGGKSPLGDEFYAYMGFFKANGKLYRCETEASQAGTTKAHAEAIDKACESLELDGKSIGSSAAPTEEKVADAADATKAPAQPATTAASGGTKTAAAATPTAPNTTAPAKPATPTPPPQSTQASAPASTPATKKPAILPVTKRSRR